MRRSWGLLAANVPLECFYTASLVAVFPGENETLEVRTNVTKQDIDHAQSLHVFAFSSKGELLLVESEGRFEMSIWRVLLREQRGQCVARRWRRHGRLRSAEP